MRIADLKPGWTVVGNDGRRLGTIKDVGQNYILTSRGGRAADLFVPVSAVANIESEVVQLNLAHREAEGMGWQQPPRADDELETTPESDLHRHF